MILKGIVLYSLLFHWTVSHDEISGEDEQFHKAIEYWTDILCTLQRTRTIVFHCIFSNSTNDLQDFFHILLRTTIEYCNAIVLLKRDVSFESNQTDNETEINWDMESEIVKNETRQLEEYSVKRETIWRSTTTINHLHHKWNITRNWRKNDEYYIDIWNLNVIFLGDSYYFGNLLDTSLSLNSRDHFIVLAVWNNALEKLGDTRQVIDSILRKLWLKYQLLNVLFNEPLSNRGFNLYTYNPFTMNDQKTWGSLENVEVNPQRQVLRLLSTMSYRRTIDFHGYEFNVSMFAQGENRLKIGEEKNSNSIYKRSGWYKWTNDIFLGVMTEKVNFKPNIVVPRSNERYGYQLKNGSYNGAIGDLLQRRTVASFASFFVKKYGNDMSNIEFTTTLGFDEVCVITPKSTMIPKALRMYHTFQLPVYLGMIVTYIFVYLTWYYARVLAPRKYKRIDGQLIAFHTLFVSFGYPIPLPSTKPERYLLIGIFACSITMMGSFNAMLYTLFTSNVYYKEIDTLADLDESGLPISYGSRSMLDLFDSEDMTPVLIRLKGKMIRVNDSIVMAATYRNVSGILRKQQFILISDKLLDKTGRRLVHRMRDCPGRFHLAGLLPTNSFLRERINILISRLNQGGLPIFWKTHSTLEHTIKFRMKSYKLSDKRKGSIFEPIEVNDIRICFMILTAGFLSSTIAFINEKGWLKLNLKKTF